MPHYKSYLPKILLYAIIWLFFTILFLRTAWLCDDAYITFRVVDNVVNGYGLRWNVNERVQPYTHPLWMLLHIPVYAITREIFITGIFLSFAVSLLTIILFTLIIAQNPSQALLSASILGFSRAFIDYSSSGLENPLSHLLLLLFFAVFISNKYTSSKLFILSLLACLATLNRQDCILIYIPPLIYAWLQAEQKKQATLLLILGFIPLILWELFSIIYYGFPFPNTAYAKLGTGIWKTDLIRQGLWYYAWTWKKDFISLLAIILAILIPFYRRQTRLWMCSLGMFLYGLYILWIGGDFMGGRFFSPLILLATILITRYAQLDQFKLGIPAIGIFIATSLIQPHAPILTGAQFGKDTSNFKDEHGIGDERMFYFQVASLAHWSPGKPMPANAFANQGRQYRAMNKPITKVHGSVGYRGYLAGPLAYIIDYYALTDPLLARLPAIYQPKWRIGHFVRHIPDGYEASANSEQNYIKDPQLAQFYEYLKQITRGPIWSTQRWIHILKMNLGLYNHLIDNDKYRFPKLIRTTYDQIKNNPSSNNTTLNIPKYGIEIQFNQILKKENITIELDSYDTFVILFFKDNHWIDRTFIYPSNPHTSETFTTYHISPPFFARHYGYNAIRIFTYPGDRDSTMLSITIHEQ